MDTTATLAAIQALPLPERLEVLFEAWDELLDSGWRPEPMPELTAELDRRIEAHESDPSDVRTWEQVMEQVRRPR